MIYYVSMEQCLESLGVRLPIFAFVFDLLDFENRLTCGSGPRAVSRLILIAAHHKWHQFKEQSVGNHKLVAE